MSSRLDEISRRLEALKDRHPVVHKDIVETNYNVMHFDPKDVAGKDILDIGAHIGIFSLFCLMHGARSILSVEANPKTFVELTKNTTGFQEINRLNKAVTGGFKPSVMISDADAQSKIVNSDGAVAWTVTLDELSALLPKGGERLLKMDVEGAEYEILPCASAKALRSFRTIFLETHVPSEPGPARRYEFLKEYLESMGFVEVAQSPMFNWTYDEKGNVTSCSQISPVFGAWRFELR